jgi:GGDEF domain-containing protein
MVASQERVNYQSACVIQVSGLPYQSGDDPAGALESPAVQLFLGRARHTRSGFTIDSHNLANVGRICRLVEGLPLGVELAASALRELSSEQIAFQLEYDLGVLRTTLQDLPAEQRSMGLALERAWLRLPPELQTRLITLSGQIGPFTVEESGASQDELNNLVDSSWLLPVGPGKYRLHHLVRLFAAGRGSAEVAETGPAQSVPPGKGTYIDRLEHLITRAERYGQTAGVVLVSLEECKPEGYLPEGHTSAVSLPRGVTQAVLRRVASCLRKSDTVALLDRDLIGLVLEDLSRPEDGLKVTQKVCSALSQSLVVDSRRYQVAACMGVSIFPRDGAVADLLIERAGIALSKARQTGECCLMYAEEV